MEVSRFLHNEKGKKGRITLFGYPDDTHHVVSFLPDDKKGKLHTDVKDAEERLKELGFHMSKVQYLKHLKAEKMKKLRATKSKTKSKNK